MKSSPKDLLIGLLALTTLGAGTLAWQQHAKLLDLQATAALAAAERAEQQRQVDLINPDFDGFGSPAPFVAEAADEASASVPAAGNAEERPQREEIRTRGGRNAAMATLMQTPEFARTLVAQQKAALDVRYADLFRQLNLSPEAIDRFKDLLIERQTAASDVMAAAREQGLGGREDRAAVRQLVEQTQAQTDAAIRATLGEAGYAEYEFYNRSQPQRAVVSQLEAKLSYGAAPLAQAQMDQLVRVLAETAPAQETSTRNAVGFGGRGGSQRRIDSVNGMALITDDAVARAQNLLSASQLEALRQIQVEQQAQQRLSEAIRGTMNRNRGNDGGERGTQNAPLP